LFSWNPAAPRRSFARTEGYIEKNSKTGDTQTKKTTGARTKAPHEHVGGKVLWKKAFKKKQDAGNGGGLLTGRGDTRKPVQ